MDRSRALSEVLQCLGVSCVPVCSVRDSVGGRAPSCPQPCCNLCTTDLNTSNSEQVSGHGGRVSTSNTGQVNNVFTGRRYIVCILTGGKVTA